MSFLFLTLDGSICLFIFLTLLNSDHGTQVKGEASDRTFPSPSSDPPPVEQWKLPGYHTLHRLFTPQIVLALETAWNHSSPASLIQLNVQSRSHSSLTVFVQPTEHRVSCHG